MHFTQNKIRSVLIVVISLFNYNIKAQISPYGAPFIKNYTKTEYKASAQNFDIVQSKGGEMYFANNYGVLEFNGEKWSLIAQPKNKTALHALYISSDGIVYIGAENELGYLKNSLNGQKYYVSLLNKIPAEYHNCDAIREIYHTESGISFISSKFVFNYSNDSITVISHNNKFVSSSMVSDSILIQDELHDIYVVKDNYLKKVLGDVKTNEGYIRKIFTDKDGELFFYTLRGRFSYLHNNKLTSFKNELNKYFLEDEALCFKQLRGGYIAIGTALHGVIIVDENKNLVQVLNKANGLQSNTILSLGTDNTGNLWVASTTGLDYVEIASPFYHISEYENIKGAVFTIHEKNEELYVGTNAGLIFSKWNTTDAPFYPRLNFSNSSIGQVWKINQIDDCLYVSGSKGVFEISDKKILEPIEEIVTGAWIIKPLKEGGDIYIQGGYEGINVLKKKDDGLHFVNKVKGFNETSRVIEIDDNGTIWVAHGYKGVFKLELNETLDSAINIGFYNWDKGFPSNLFINVYKIKNEILFGTEYGVFQYVSEWDTMVVHPYFKKIFVTNEQIRLLKEIDNDILFIRGTDMDEKVGIIEVYEDGLFSVSETPFQKLKGVFVPGFDNVTQTESGNLLFGTKDGMIYYNKKSERNYNKPYHTNITDIISLDNDSLIYGDYDGDDTTNVGINSQILSVPYNLNSLEFNFAAAFFESTEQIMYSFFLEGYDSKWSIWKHRTQMQYTGLKDGKYIFHVKAKNVYNVESTIDSVVFEILPPWYKTPKAYVIYTFVFIIFIVLVVIQAKQIIKKEKAKIIAKQFQDNQAKINRHLHEKLIAEKELRNILEEKSLKEIEDKDARLASSTMHLLQMNNTITQIKNELNNVLIHLDTSKRRIFRDLISSIDKKAQQNESWENFELHFNKVHNDFLQRIKEEFPDLSQRDIRLCAYLRLNLSSKEIAQLMGISIRSVESLRYRVRKKTNLTSDKSLADFLLSY